MIIDSEEIISYIYRNLEDQSLKDDEVKNYLDIFKFFMLTSVVSPEKLKDLENKKLYDKCLIAYSRINNFKTTIDNCIDNLTAKYSGDAFIKKNGEFVNVDLAIEQFKKLLRK